jgi:hypothetical protein
MVKISTVHVEGELNIAYEFGKQKATWQYAVVLNSMNDAGAGFGGDTNKITILIKEYAR